MNAREDAMNYALQYLKNDFLLKKKESRVSRQVSIFTEWEVERGM